MATNETNYYTNGIGREENENLGDACRVPSCHSQIHVRDMLSECGCVTLCRYCRKQFFGVSS